MSGDEAQGKNNIIIRSLLCFKQKIHAKKYCYFKPISKDILKAWVLNVESWLLGTWRYAELSFCSRKGSWLQRMAGHAGDPLLNSGQSASSKTFYIFMLI